MLSNLKAHLLTYGSPAAITGSDGYLGRLSLHLGGWPEYKQISPVLTFR